MDKESRSGVLAFQQELESTTAPLERIVHIKRLHDAARPTHLPAGCGRDSGIAGISAWRAPGEWDLDVSRVCDSKRG